MKVRKLHKYSSLVFAPFFLIVTATGALLFLKGTGALSREQIKLIQDLHSWEIIAKYAGIVLVFGVFFVTITGIILLFNKKA